MSYTSPLDDQKEANIKLMLSERTDYSIIQKNGQRLYEPVNQWPQQPQRGSEIYIARLPRDCYEDELVPVFEKAGVIYKLRLMMDFSGSTRGYAFVTYSNASEAKNAVKTLNNTEIRDGQPIGVMLSWDNRRLFIGGIPRSKTKKQILSAMRRVTEGVKDVIVNVSINNNANRNNGFAFVEYESHYAAAMARRDMATGFVKLWNFNDISVEWADPEPHIDEETLKTIKVLFVRNLNEDMSAIELKELFTFNGLRIERVKIIKDFAFIHYETRNDAEVALNTIQSKTFVNSNPQYEYIQVSFARPRNVPKRRRTVTYSASQSHNSNEMSLEMRNTSMPSISTNYNDCQMQCLPNQSSLIQQILPINIISAYDNTEPIPLFTGYVKPLTKNNY